MSRATYMGVVLVLIAFAAAHERVHMRDIQTLVLSKGSMTQHRRVPPVSQLICRDTAGLSFSQLPSTAVCRNIGWDGHNTK